jgi:RND superfamily putative drug exporter
MLDRLGRFTARYAPWVIMAWLAAAALLVLFAPSLEHVGVQNETAFLPPSAPSQRANRVLQHLYPGDATLNSGIVVFSRAGRPLTAADDAWIERWVTGLKTPAMRDRITSIQSDVTDPLLTSELRARDGRADLVIVGFASSPFSTANNATVALLRHQLASAPAGLAHHLTGVPGLAADQATSLVTSFARATLITVVLVLAILFLVYRSALAPLVPLVTIGAAYLVARGLIGIMAAHGFKVASLVDPFLIVMVFGAGTDYCLFIVSRYREDLRSGDQASQTLRRSMRVVGVVVAASGATVIVGFMSMLTARFGLYRTMGPAIGIAIALTVLAAVTLTPALLEVAGSRLFWPGPLRSTKAEPSRGGGRWERLAATVQGRPLEILLAGISLLELGAAGIGWFHPNFDLVKELPPYADARAGYAAIAEHYPAGTVAPVDVVIETPGPILTGPYLTAIDHLTDDLKAQPGIAQVRSVTQPTGSPLTSATVANLASINDLGINPNKVDITPLLNAIDSPGGLRFNAGLLRRYPQLVDGGPLAFFQGAGGHSTRLVVTLAVDPFSPQGLAVVRDLDTKVNDALAGSALSGARLSIAGPATFFSDMQTIGNHDLRVIAAVLIAGIFVVLALLLRSLVAPFFLLASVVASYAATLGLTSAVFDGIFHQSLSFWLPPFLLVILVALGADYTIFIMSRIREEAAAGTEIHQAVGHGLTATGKVITSAGVILAGAFAALVTAPLSELRQIGFAVTVGVLIDTFVVRTLIVPAATMLLGRWAFWPGMPVAEVTRASRRRHYGLAGLGIAALAASLVLLAATGGAARPITRIAALADSRAAQPSPTAPSTAAHLSALHAAGENQPARFTASLGRSRTSGANRTRGANTAPPTTRPTLDAVTVQARAPINPSPSAPTPTAASEPATTASASPTRIAIPAVGAWRYQVNGTRRIGQAGSTQSFDETDTTEVRRLSGDAQTATMSVDIQTSTYTENDERSYAPGGVDLLATNFTADGISYGGTLHPPEPLIPWPATVGQSWTTSWTTGSTSGHTTGRITGTETVTVSGVSYECIVVRTDTTFTGEAQGSQQGTTCWSPRLGMAVEDTENLDGTYTGIPFDITSHFVLLATP